MTCAALRSATAMGASRSRRSPSPIMARVFREGKSFLPDHATPALRTIIAIGFRRIARGKDVPYTQRRGGERADVTGCRQRDADGSSAEVCRS